MVSGPDFFPHCRWRRGDNDAWVSPMEFCSSFSRRVEASCRKDWNALPMIRSVAFKFTAEHTMGTLAPFFGKRNGATDTQAQDYIKAAQNLFHHLHHGFIGKGLRRTSNCWRHYQIALCRWFNAIGKTTGALTTFFIFNFAQNATAETNYGTQTIWCPSCVRRLLVLYDLAQ